MARVTESDILQQMAVREEAGVFVLGCFERRITLYTQQVRALNLVHSLFAEERLKAGSKLAVIGGGAAGLTAAAGAAIRGARVTVFEQASDLLPMFRNNRQRWLHPHLYDWPEEGSEQEQADLPVLGWKADLAGNVAERLLAQWHPLAQRYGIEVHTRVRRLQLLAGSSTPRQLTWNTESFDEGEFEAVILAVGFGTERRLEGAPSRSYWEDDNLDRIHASSTPRRYLISGTGDGGLIDLLRVRLRDFRHERIIQRYLRDASLGVVKKELIKLEEEFRKGRLQERDFFKKYKELPVPTALDERLREDLRGDTTAVLNGRGAFPLSARASILNRFLTSRLMRLGSVRYESGEFSVERVKDSYKVAFFDDNKHQKHTEEFDDIIVRHGPEPALERSFKTLWEKAGARMRDLAELDQTRRPIFKSEDFASAPSRVCTTTPAAPAMVSTPTPVPYKGDFAGRLTHGFDDDEQAQEQRLVDALAKKDVLRIQHRLERAVSDWAKVRPLLEELEEYADKFRYGLTVKEAVFDAAYIPLNFARARIPYDVAELAIELIDKVLPIYSLVGKVHNPLSEREIELFHRAASATVDLIYVATRRLSDIILMNTGAKLLHDILRFAHINDLLELKNEILAEFEERICWAEKDGIKDGGKLLRFYRDDALTRLRDDLVGYPDDLDWLIWQSPEELPEEYSRAER